MRRAALLWTAAALLLAGCSGTSTESATHDPLSYDAGAPLDLRQGTRSERDGLVVQSVTYASGADRVEARQIEILQIVRTHAHQPHIAEVNHARLYASDALERQAAQHGIERGVHVGTVALSAAQR